MAIYSIAGLTVSMQPQGRTARQAEPYLCTDEKQPDLTIPWGGELLHQQHPHLSLDDCSYLASGAAFYQQLLLHDGMLLHASAVVMEGRAYLFSAPSGTGKSTHTQLWQQVFGDRARILNDDKPAIRWEDGQFYAYGTPWSGKHDLSFSGRFPLQAICLLERGQENKISKCDPQEVIFSLADQTFRPASAMLMDKLLSLLDCLLRQVPVYKLQCNMEPEAARVSWAGMKP